MPPFSQTDACVDKRREQGRQIPSQDVPPDAFDTGRYSTAKRQYIKLLETVSNDVQYDQCLFDLDNKLVFVGNPAVPGRRQPAPQLPRRPDRADPAYSLHDRPHAGRDQARLCRSSDRTVVSRQAEPALVAGFFMGLALYSAAASSALPVAIYSSCSRFLAASTYIGLAPSSVLRMS